MDGLTENQRAMVEENLNLVRFVLKRLGVLRCDRRYEDLFSVGCLALCTAALSYKPDKIAFSTYAVHLIRHAIIKELKDGRNDMCRYVSLENCCTGLAVPEIGYETVDHALYAKALFRGAGLSPPQGGYSGAKISKKMRATLASFIREGK